MTLPAHAAEPRRPWMRPGQRPPAGFTLIELLVVIAIIGVLAGLLLPALARTKTAARRTECISRMRQWGFAFISYATDNEGMMPREGFHTNGDVFWNNWAQVQHPQSQDVWYNALSGYVDRPPASSYASPAERQVFYDRNSFFHCPSARLPKATTTPSYQIAVFSIAMNSQLIQPAQAPTTSIHRIRTQPSETVLFLDNLLEDEARVVDEQAWTNLGQPSAYANRFAGVRHGQGGTLAFADGRAAWLPGNKVVQTRGPLRGWGILPGVDIIWELDPE